VYTGEGLFTQNAEREESQGRRKERREWREEMNESGGEIVGCK